MTGVSTGSDDARLAEWRSWLDKGAIPSGWDRNLWDEFYGLMHRRAMWRGYRAVVEGSLQDVQDSARYLTQWVLRNHIETQALAIRRIAHRTRGRPVSLVRLLDEIAAARHILGAHALEAKSDAETLHAGAEKITTFANKVVAHLDRDHAPASRDVTLEDMDAFVDTIGQVWERWYLRVTGRSAVVMEPLPPDWSKIIVLRRRDPRVLNPDLLAAQVIHYLGPSVARDLLHALTGTEADRSAMIGRLWAPGEARWVAEILIDLEGNEKERSGVADALRRALPS